MVAADGHVIGEIAALFLDSETWQVDSIQVKLRNEIAQQIGVDRGVFHAATLDVPIRIIQSVSDTIVLSVPVGELRQILPAAGEAPPPVH